MGKQTTREALRRLTKDADDKAPDEVGHSSAQAPREAAPAQEEKRLPKLMVHAAMVMVRKEGTGSGQKRRANARLATGRGLEYKRAAWLSIVHFGGREVTRTCKAHSFPPHFPQPQGSLGLADPGVELGALLEEPGHCQRVLHVALLVLQWQQKAGTQQGLIVCGRRSRV